MVYEAGEISKICDGLNYQSRMAKLSSFECQTLFLSLYFKNNVETTQAVVTNLRTNGFWVYVPKFDMRGPVFVRDRHGNVQIDPALLMLPKSAGREPSAAFASSPRARMFPSAKCKLQESPEEVLEVSVPDCKSPFVVRVLDVVSIQIMTDRWDARSRVPLPRLHLLGESSPARGSHQKALRKSNSLVSSRKITVSTGDEGHIFTERPRTIYQENIGLKIPPILEAVPLRSKCETKRTEPTEATSMPGRHIFGGFRNPDTQSARQEASIAEASAAAKERRNQLVAAQEKNNAYDLSRQIEKDATARMQRLAAHKRNARRNKAK